MKSIARIGLSVLLSAQIVGATATALAQQYSTPIGCDDCINYWYYVDHGGTTDYTCGSTTYPGHNGTDYSLQGGNNAIDNGNEIVAAAPGVVTVASDGNFDRCTSCGGGGCGVNTPGGGFANYVVLDHGTHTTTYGHMRNGSVAVSVGDTVECGQVLGHIGSSGCSSGAHLHFQPRQEGANYQDALDPYEGDCSPTEESLWVEQGPYRGVPGAACTTIPPTCPEGTFDIWTCSEDGTSRRRCIDGIDTTEPCEWGCDGMPQGTDDTCALPPDLDDDGARVDTDCNDADASIHPAAIEICGDGVDQDCTGSDLPCTSEPTDPSNPTGSGGGTSGSGAGGSLTATGGAATGTGGAAPGDPASEPQTNSESGESTSTESGCACEVRGRNRPFRGPLVSAGLLVAFLFWRRRRLCR